MILVIPDTNVLMSGLLSAINKERQIINLVHLNKISFYGSDETFKEFCEVTKYERFKNYLYGKLYTPEKIIADYQDIVIIDKPAKVYDNLSVASDKDDDEFIRVALSVGSKIIVTRDNHLLKLEEYQGIRMLTPETFIEAFSEMD